MLQMLFRMCHFSRKAVKTTKESIIFVIFAEI